MSLRFAWIALWLAAPVLGEPIEIKPRYTAGETIWLSVGNSLTQNIAVPDQPAMTITYSDDTTMIRKVDAVSEAGATLTLEFDRRAMSFAHPALGSQVFDSDTGAAPSDDNSMSLIAHPWVGRKLGLELAPDHTVRKVTGFAELLDAIDNSALGDMLYEQLRTGLTEDQVVRQLYIGLFDAYPEKPVSIGDQWTRTVRNPGQNLGTIETTFECKLDAVEERDGRKVAVISYKSNSKVVEAPTSSPMGTPELKSSAGVGTLLVDLATGMPLSTDAKGTRLVLLKDPSNAEGAGITIDGQIVHQVRLLTGTQRSAQKEENRKKAADGPAGGQPH